MSAKTVRELEFTSHAKQDHHAAGHVDVLPVPSNHTFKCVCSGRLVQMLSGKKVDATGKNRNAYCKYIEGIYVQVKTNTDGSSQIP